MGFCSFLEIMANFKPKATSVLERVQMLDEFKKEQNSKKSLSELAKLVADLLNLESVPSKDTIMRWKKTEATLREQAAAIQAMYPDQMFFTCF